MNAIRLNIQKTLQSGQSLLEVTFATAIVSLVLVAILSTVIQSVQNSRVALEQTQTTQYAQEALEWIRSERDVVGWGVFYSSISERQGGGSFLVYCLTELPSDLVSLFSFGGACEEVDVIGDTAFRREIELAVLSAEEIEVVVEVTRPGRSGDVITRLETRLANWE